MKTILTSLFFIAFSSISFAQQPTNREIKMIEEINYVREHPQEYIQYIQSYLDFWDSESSEISAAKELTKELKKMKPVQAVEFSDELYKGAIQHGDWMKRRSKFQHSDLPYAENLVSGDEQIRFAVLSLLIDDGIPSRGHRKNLLNPSYTKVACFEVLGKVGENSFVFIQLFE